MTLGRNTVVILTDGEPTLAHYMDQLRETGIRILATARPYEAALFVARNDVLCLLARQPQPCLMHQRRGLKRLAGFLIGHADNGQLAQLLIDQRQQLIRGLRIARALLE